MHGRMPVTPGRGLLELAGDPDEHILPPIFGHQLDADRQAGGAPTVGVTSRS